MAKTAGRMEPHGAANHNQDAPQMALEPATVAARHVWEDLETWAIGKAEIALEGVSRAFTPDDKDYLTTRANLMQTIAAGARKKLEAKQ